jgi:hypothetical protein
MDTEAMLARQVRASRRRRLGLALAGSAFALGCFTQKPSGESAPSTPAAPAAAPEPEAPAEPAPPPLPSSESLLEQKKEAPASGKGVVPGSPTAAPRRSTSAPAPAKPAAKARSAAPPEGAAERALGGNADDAEDAEPDAPALRQRLDRAYRAGSPDCPSARERKKAVCDLATQICQLTDRDPNVASVAEYCSEAKQRCSQAEQRTQERCPD